MPWEYHYPGEYTVEEAKEELEAVKHECEELRTKLAEAEAVAAAMRGVLEEVYDVFDDLLGDTDIDEDDSPIFTTMQKVSTVLSSSAGRDLLERLRKAEELLRTALWRDIQTDACRTNKANCHTSCRHYITCQDIDAYLKEVKKL